MYMKFSKDCFNLVISAKKYVQHKKKRLAPFRDSILFAGLFAGGAGLCCAVSAALAVPGSGSTAPAASAKTEAA